MISWIRDHLLPHTGNNHRPRLLERRGAFVVAIVTFCVPTLLFLYTFFIFPRIDYLASILPTLLIDLANADRGTAGLPQLRYNPVLEKAAQAKANDMAARGYFSHTTPDGAAPWRFFQQAGYLYLRAGENLAVNFSDSKDVETAWMNSPTHRANILQQGFTEIGIATASGEFQGHPAVFVVQFFAAPAPSLFSDSFIPTVAASPLSSAGRATSTASTSVATVTPTSSPTSTVTSDAAGVSVSGADTHEQQQPPGGASRSGRSTFSLSDQLSGFLTRIALNPRSFSNNFLFLLLGLVALAVALFVALRFDRRHQDLLSRAFVLISCITFVLWLNRFIAFSHILIS